MTEQTSPSWTVQVSRQRIVPNYLLLYYRKKEDHQKNFPGLTQYALISTRHLCDSGCEVNFNNKNVFVKKNEQTILIGRHNTKNRMYKINFTNILLDKSLLHPTTPIKPTIKQANNLYHLKKKMKDVINYLHQCCFSPKASTWSAAMDTGFFQSWSHLTSKLVKKYLPQLEATVKGHQHYSPKKFWLTKPRPKTTPMDKSITVIPQIHKITNKNYTGQTGKFPLKANKGS